MVQDLTYLNDKEKQQITKRNSINRKHIKNRFEIIYNADKDVWLGKRYGKSGTILVANHNVSAVVYQLRNVGANISNTKYTNQTSDCNCGNPISYIGRILGGLL